MNLHENSSEKRLYSRIAFDAPVILKKGDEQWTSKLLDISLKGALVIRPEDWQQENAGEFKLTIKLNNSEIEIDMDVTLAHTEEEHLGFHCEHIDLDSVTALRRLVELNLGDEELLEREISNMLED